MNIRNYFTKKRVIWSVVVIIIVAIIAGQIFGSGDSADGVTTENARVQNLKSTVLATGQVTSSTDLNLSFKGSGIVRRVNVKVGDQVKAGDLLANLDQRDQIAALTSARGSLAAANANYKRVLDGTSSEEVRIAQVALDNADKQNNIAVQNAYRALLNSTPEAVADSKNETTYVPTITGTYTSEIEGVYKIQHWGRRFKVTGLENQDWTNYDSNLPVKLGNRGLFITFSQAFQAEAQSDAGDEWTVTLPNNRAADYLNNFNAYNAAVKARDAAIAAAQANLDLAMAQARPADVEAARAQILSAQGSVMSAQAAVESTEIRAPSDGTITKINVKVGEIASPTAAAIVLQDVGNLYLEADISEANIAEIKEGQTVEVTFDALGPDKKYSAKVSMIDPASTVVSGVVNYRVKSLLDKVEEIKPGMTANMTILTGEKNIVLAVPLRAVLSKDGKKFVRVVNDTKKKTYSETQVTTGFNGDGGLVEITSGLEAGQEIVTFIEE